jgi:hypothetical protein
MATTRTAAALDGLANGAQTYFIEEAVLATANHAVELFLLCLSSIVMKLPDSA